jgi:hypothetical protein
MKNGICEAIENIHDPGFRDGCQWELWSQGNYVDGKKQGEFKYWNHASCCPIDEKKEVNIKMGLNGKYGRQLESTFFANGEIVENGFFTARNSQKLNKCFHASW